MGKVGRPKGYRLSTEAKKRIGAARAGKHRTIEERENISKGVLDYYRRKNTLSTELMEMYGDVAGDWIEANQEDLDASGCKTLSRMRSMSRIENPVGNFIEVLTYDDLDPEKMYLIKERMELEGIE